MQQGFPSSDQGHLAPGAHKVFDLISADPLSMCPQIGSIASSAFSLRRQEELDLPSEDLLQCPKEAIHTHTALRITEKAKRKSYFLFYHKTVSDIFSALKGIRRSREAFSGCPGPQCLIKYLKITSRFINLDCRIFYLFSHSETTVASGSCT